MNDFKTYKVSNKEKQRVISILKSGLESHDKINFAYIYGSFVDPEMDFFRDIDIGIYVDNFKDSDWWDYEISLVIELDRLLNYKYPVDLRVINKSNVLFLHSVIQGELIILKDEDLWSDFVVSVSLKYNDIVPLFYNYCREAYIEK